MNNKVFRLGYVQAQIKRNKMKHIFVLVVSILVLIPVWACSQTEQEYPGDRPMCHLEDEVTIPVRMLDSEMLPQDTLQWNVSSALVRSKEFRMQGQVVQPNLDVRLWTIRGSVSKMIGNTYLGLNVPVGLVEVGGGIGNLPASSSDWALGDIALIAKRQLFSDQDKGKIVAGVGIEFPTGKDNLNFDQSNAATTAYYKQASPRLPIAWQPGSGSTDFFTSIAYNKSTSDRAYEAFFICKFHGKSDEDVRLGDIYMLSVNTMQNLSEKWSAGLGLALLKQENDSYPNAPTPGIGQALLAGTTEHGTTLFVSPSIKYRATGNQTYGFSLSLPIVKPDNGMVPSIQWNMIFSM